MIAWCTKPGRGTRLIPAGALQGIQYMKTPDYIQVVGFIDQAQININSSDYGGEMDPHGADLVSVYILFSLFKRLGDVAWLLAAWKSHGRHHLLQRLRYR